MLTLRTPTATLAYQEEADANRTWMQYQLNQFIHSLTDNQRVTYLRKGTVPKSNQAKRLHNNYLVAKHDYEVCSNRAEFKVVV